MLVLQSGTDVYGIKDGEFVELPLDYDVYPTTPTPDALNEGLAWLLDFLKRKGLPYTILVNEQTSRGPTPATTIVYADIMQGNTVKHSLAVYTVCNAITTGTEHSLEQTLYTELSKP